MLVSAVLLQFILIVTNEKKSHRTAAKKTFMVALLNCFTVLYADVKLFFFFLLHPSMTSSHASASFPHVTFVELIITKKKRKKKNESGHKDE